MTRRAKERRKERVQEKLRAVEEHEARERKLSSRPEWKQLLQSIDGPQKTSISQLSSSSKSPAAGIVSDLHWKSTNVPIAAASVFQLPIKLDAPKGLLYYTFSTRDFDINFGIQMICADGTMLELEESQRYESHVHQVKGQIELIGPGMIVLFWDNSYSWLNSKQLAYSVELKQETPQISAAKRSKLAQHVRVERERKLLAKERELDEIQATLETQTQTLDQLRQQIAKLEEQVSQMDHTKQTMQQEKEALEEQMVTLTWEIEALTLRCLDKPVLALIFSFLEEKELTAWSLTNRRWWQHVKGFRADPNPIEP